MSVHNQPPKRRKRLDLNSYGATLKELSRFQQDLQSALETKVFSFTTMQEWHLEALRTVTPLHLSVKNNDASIRQCITRLLEHFGLPGKKATVRSLAADGGRPVKLKADNPVDSFQKWVLGYDKLPSGQLGELMGKVEEDLKGINALVRKYEQLPEITAYLSGKDNPRNHRTKTVLDFYNRCLRERQTILDYYLEGVYDRALEKSRARLLHSWDWGNFLGMKDYPYRFGNPYRSIAFDFENIDCLSHRVGNLPIEVAHKYQVLYVANKEKFYKKLFKQRPVEQLFINMEYNRAHLPAGKNREAIFAELRRLFKAKRWLAFYALALPQVEGLFAEMIAASKPDSGVLSKALPDKVKSVRPNYYLSDAYLDYYEYVLPEKRNSFMHSGYIEDIKLHAFDLLTDLEHVLTVFTELEDPLVKLTKVLKRRNYEDFIDYKGYVTYFSLLKDIHDKKKKELEAEIESFNREFLVRDCAVEFIASEAADHLVKTLEELLRDTEYRYPSSDLLRSYVTQRDHELLQELKDTGNREIIADFFVFNQDSLEKIFLIRDFFMGLEKHLLAYLDKENLLLAGAQQVWDSTKKHVKKLEIMHRDIGKFLN